MRTGNHQVVPRQRIGACVASFRRGWLSAVVAGIIALTLNFGLPTGLSAQTATPKSTNITGYYQFGLGDTLALLDQRGSLEGHVDMFQFSEAPKPLLSYNITAGSVSRNHLEFKTQEVYGKLYRFSGTVKRGAGKKPGDYDYLELAGNLKTITNPSPSGKKKVEQRHIVFKSLRQDVAGS